MTRFPPLIIVVASLFLMLQTEMVFAQSARLDENEVKAAYIYNFAKYVEWPVTTSAQETSTLYFCVIGYAPFNASVMAPLTEKQLKNRRVSIRELTFDDDISRCNLLFINPQARNNLTNILKSATENSILTVSDIKGFATAGGIIEFIPMGNKIRFRINNRSARMSNLKISSQLLNLATSVIE
ncbi:MAG: YfiR family protein [Geobacteraceae bacterium]|nr:YfiR family protein [Geobacteraceae bacterium]